MRQAFTMVEIIFVIVILGILVTVALPKFAATRQDAKVSLIAQNVTIAAAEIASYAATKGDTDKDFLVMSNAIKKLKEAGNATLVDDKATIIVDGGACLEIEIQRTATNNDLLVNFLASGSDMCTTVQSLIDAAKYPMRLRGGTVVY
jgi:prepilin-type N-terminal cleavage/methylation domain-containing protein